MYIIINHSAVEMKYECSGTVVNEQDSESTNLLIKLLHYRFWVNLWANSDASVNVEIPEKWAHFYSNIKEVEDKFQILNNMGTVQGSFLTSSKTLSLQTPYGLYKGTCKEIR